MLRLYSNWINCTTHLLDKYKICNKNVYEYSFVRLEIDDKEWFVCHKECWIDPKTLQKNMDCLDAVIRMLEFRQEKKYDVHTNLTLAYLYDIKNCKVPSRILEEKEYLLSNLETCQQFTHQDKS